MLLLKTDENGSEMWRRTFGDEFTQTGRSVNVLKEGGYVFSGNTKFSHGGISDILLLKTDEGGNLLWDKTYGKRERFETVWSMIQTTEKNFILAGMLEDSKMGLIKADENGNEIWTKVYGEGWASSIEQTEDEGFIVTGSSTNINADDNLILLKLDKEGNEEWKKIYGESYPYQDSGTSVSQTTDGGYILTGATHVDINYPNNIGVLWVIKTNSRGRIEWEKKNRYKS